MGKLAATIQCEHICSQSDGPKPHVGGKIVGGSKNVHIGGKGACRQGDQVMCSSPNINKAGVGSPSVFINNKSAIRIGDTTTHGGKIVTGNTSFVNIG